MVEHERIAKRSRPYQLRARADSMDRTRSKITQAAIELHGSIGPAATTMSAVAERAGVTRATLYRLLVREVGGVLGCGALQCLQRRMAERESGTRSRSMGCDS